MRHAAATVGLILFAIGIVNFLAFFGISLAIGGDALSGAVVDGKYFLSTHGNQTEVSPAVWYFSYIHTISMFITTALGVLGGILHEALRRKHSDVEMPSSETTS